MSERPAAVSRLPASSGEGWVAGGRIAHIPSTRLPFACQRSPEKAVGGRTGIGLGLTTGSIFLRLFLLIVVVRSPGGQGKSSGQTLSCAAPCTPMACPPRGMTCRQEISRLPPRNRAQSRVMSCDRLAERPRRAQRCDVPNFCWARGATPLQPPARAVRSPPYVDADRTSQRRALGRSYVRGRWCCGR